MCNLDLRPGQKSLWFIYEFILIGYLCFCCVIEREETLVNVSAAHIGGHEDNYNVQFKYSGEFSVLELFYKKKEISFFSCCFMFLKT